MFTLHFVSVEYDNSINFTLSLNDVCMCVMYIALLAIYCSPYENVRIFVFCFLLMGQN